MGASARRRGRTRRCAPGSGSPRTSAAQASPIAADGLDAVAALRGEPEEAGRVGARSRRPGRRRRRTSAARPRLRRGRTASVVAASMRSIASAMSSSSGCTSCGSTGSALAGEPSSMPASGLTYQRLVDTAEHRPARRCRASSGGAKVKTLRRFGHEADRRDAGERGDARRTRRRRRRRASGAR